MITSIEGTVSKFDQKPSRGNSIHEKFEDNPTWVESLPQIIFIVLIAAVVIYAAYDYDTVFELFENLVLWVQENPLISSLAIILIYVFLVVFTFPIMYLTVGLGYAYSKAYEQKKQ